MENYSDNILLLRLRDGDSEAFSRVWDKYKHRVYSFASRYLDSHEDRLDAVQLTFVKLWETRERIRTDLSFNNYIYTIVKNTIFHDKQKKVNHRAYLEYLKEFKQSTQNTEETVLFDDCNEHFRTAVSHLAKQRRKIFLLRWERGLSYKEIAERLELSVKTVETHLRLATRQLKEEMSDFL